jgi:plasmid stabilization system protein ParE
VAYKTIFHPIAQTEFSDAYLWYRAIREDLAEKFLQMVEQRIEMIALNPSWFSYRVQPFREAPVKRFPYNIVYSINEETREVYIAAIYHNSRQPENKFRIL